MKHLVIGAGEVGRAVAEVLEADVRDITPDMWDPYLVDMLHICFPYSESFIEDVTEYRRRYEANIVVIHSTVPVGTTRALNACHSPVRGQHPNLVDGIRTFTKFFGGEGAEQAASAFWERGVSSEVVENPETTEAGKLWDLLQYGLSIIAQKEMYRWCEEQGADFDVAYTRFNHTYNQGYEELGKPEVRRPVLQNVPGPIGGHCVIQNAPFIDHLLSKVLLELNEQHEQHKENR